MINLFKSRNRFTKLIINLLKAKKQIAFPIQKLTLVIFDDLYICFPYLASSNFLLRMLFYFLWLELADTNIFNQ